MNTNLVFLEVSSGRNWRHAEAGMESGSGVFSGWLDWWENEWPPYSLSFNFLCPPPLSPFQFSRAALVYLYLPTKYLHLYIVGGTGCWKVGQDSERKKEGIQHKFHWFQKVSTHSSPLESRSHAAPTAPCFPGESDVERREGREWGHSCPPHPHTTFPFKVLSLPTPVYFSFHLLEVQAATNPPLRQAPFQRVIGFCDLLKSDHRISCAWGKFSGDEIVFEEWRGQFWAVLLWERDVEELLGFKVSKGQHESSGSWEAFSDSPSSGLGVPCTCSKQASFLMLAS